MKRILTYLLPALFAALTVASCKKVSVDCDYQLTVQWQERKSGGDTVPLTTAKTFAFFADPDKWEVTNIEDARAGVITNIDDPSQRRTFDEAPAGVGKYGNQFEFRFNSQPVMLVVADTKYPMWATGNANVVADLANMYVTIKFKPLSWKDGDSEPSVQKLWKYYGYENVTIPINTQLQIVPAIQRQNETSSSVLQDAGCYAFYGLTKKNKGSVTSWANARAGIAQYTDAAEKVVTKDFDVKGEWINDSLLMDVVNPNIMVVVYNDQPDADTGWRMYAYTFLDLSDNKVTDRSNVLFDMRTLPEDENTVTITYDKWTVVYERDASRKR